MTRTPPFEWGQLQFGTLLGVTAPRLSRILNGLEYPTLYTMQKFEVVLGWPVVEQVVLVPYLWTEGDLRYSMVLRQHMNDWAEANPRMMKATEIRLHPDIVPRHSRRTGARDRRYGRGGDHE